MSPAYNHVESAVVRLPSTIEGSLPYIFHNGLKLALNSSAKGSGKFVGEGMGVLVSVGVGVIVPVAVRVGVLVLVGVFVIVGVIVIVGDCVTVGLGVRLGNKSDKSGWFT